MTDGLFRRGRNFHRAEGSGVIHCRPSLPRDLLHVRHESVTSPRHGHDVALIASLPQRFAQHEDGLGQVRLLHKAVRPHRAHKTIFSKELPFVLHQHEQGVQSFRSQGHRFLTQEKNPVLSVQAELVELVEVVHYALHGSAFRWIEKNLRAF